ncbi:hypothetical protein AA0Y32_15825 [Georgenia phoenicis]|uniref:hypothetical protein n=1 Tax=unclassified Georgenia TaxID=2626815 RepID=UPI0039B0C7F5
MSDNPYERDRPDEQNGDVTRDDDATGPVPTVGEPAATAPADGEHRNEEASPGPADPEAYPADSSVTEDPGRPAADDAATRPLPADDPAAGPYDDGDASTRPLTAEHDADASGDTSETTQVLRSHQAERPVPRSGLAEHRSAAYLTGERHPGEPEPQPDPEPQPEPATTAWPAAGATAGAAATASSHDGAPEREPETAEPASARRERDVVLEGTTAHTRPPSRGKAHVLTILVTVILTPVAWYLVADAGARLTLPAGNPWDTTNLNVAAILELAGGLLVLAVILLAARWSSVGAIVTGVLVTVVGVPFIAVPAWTQELLEPVESWLAQLGDLGDNVAHHLVASGSTGRLVALGVALVLVGVVSHGARRQGRREVRPAVAA